MKLIGYIDEMGDLGPARRIDRKYLQDAGLDLVFSMHARDFAALVQRANDVRAYGTPQEANKLLGELVDLLNTADGR
jgi:hypothetical protein